MIVLEIEHLIDRFEEYLREFCSLEALLFAPVGSVRYSLNPYNRFT
ncbi:unannotated protein [freshwater metagenome]|uniref:Unannotated protein n=1 Tax=freshwater metagenome TaxID=449393 RepID=A0A6J6WVS2_9ZZZZ